MGLSLLEKANAIRRELSETEVRSSFPDGLFSPKAVTMFYTWPFRHAVMDNALSAEGIESISKHFTHLLTQKDTQFEHVGIYDVFGHRVRFGENNFLDLFYDLAYKKSVETLFDITLTRHTTIALHNNVPRTEDKHIHTDHVMVPYFDDPVIERMTDPSDPTWYAHYFDAERSKVPPRDTHPERRSITAILYLSPDWQSGCGGATGIYVKNGNAFSLAGEIEPVYNRILFTENTTNSYHNYKPCSLANRNTLIQWFHTNVD